MDLPGKLSILFGTDKDVKLRRQLVLLREKLINHQYNESNAVFLCSGSLGEGVAYPTSDDDLMFCNLACRVLMANREFTRYVDLVMVPSEYSPVYCLLWDVTRHHPLDLLQVINGMYVLSSFLVKQTQLDWTVRELQSVMSSVISSDECSIHGPCMSQKIGNLEFDYAYCLPCPNWPDVAYDWVTRNRLYEWPSHQMVQHIVRSGCHVVPIGDPSSPYYLHEWRISFSKAERELFHSFNHCQFLTYNMLRLTLKRIIQQEVPDVLCSYFMKTTLFFSAENTSKQLWQLDSIELVFKHCLSVLLSFIDNKHCPNYFIPDCNMTKRKVNQTNRQQLLHLLRHLHSIGIAGIVHLCGECVCFDERWTLPLREMKCDGDFLFSVHLGKLVDRIVSMLEFFRYEGPDTCTFFLSNFLKILDDHSTLTRGTALRIILYRGIIYCSQQMMDFLWKLPRLNKTNYLVHKYITALLRIGCIYNGDVTTGKLTMATYMYNNGKTECALSVIGRLLSEYPPYAMDNRLTDLQRTTYMEVMCGRGYTIDYKAKHAYAPGYEMYSSFRNAFPFPLRMWMFISIEISLFPLAYAFLLQCLCHIRLKKTSLLVVSKSCLISQMEDLMDNKKKANVKMCLGIINYFQGNSQSACRWLGSAYVLKDSFKPPNNERFSRSAMTYIACMINRQIRDDTLYARNMFPASKI
ncbi:hypothetical protein FSP39_009855 [Pinctada imbricata]|uniref:Mab-21-like HhH/H2TH-like domain-containing protein n=1 Tax=Pinctada imbricata TaxID=66713 RepID=A0AA88YTC2_PINIB|nr:hypothetical protein FSP39_009855 [Pinctada imbricata]